MPALAKVQAFCYYVVNTDGVEIRFLSCRSLWEVIMENDFLALMQGCEASFSKGQRAIAQYITDEYDKAAFMTAAKLGKTVGVSESTVVRFAVCLGFDG